MLWTLYLVFAYLVYAIVAFVVIGYNNMGAYEWTGLASGPVVIISVRNIITWGYNFRIDSLSNRLKECQAERQKTIKKLKDATRYDSTMELIEKYGGVEGRPRIQEPEEEDQEQERPGSRHQPPRQPSRPSTSNGRTNIAPPPTANIQRRPVTPVSPGQGISLEPTAEFAPNADGPDTLSPLLQPQRIPTHHQRQPSLQQHHWYDRIFDVLLGEDETAPKNRIVLICQNCRLVNGQAPPGTKSLSELGMWRCVGCSTRNGQKEDEGQRMVREVLDAKKKEKVEQKTTQGEKEGESEGEASS